MPTTRWTAEAQVVAARIRDEFPDSTAAKKVNIARKRAEDAAADGKPASALAYLAAARILLES